MVEDPDVRRGARLEVEVEGAWVGILAEPRECILDQNILPLDYPSDARHKDLPTVLGTSGQGAAYTFRGMIRHRRVADFVRILEDGEDPPGLTPGGPALELEDD